jgi:hypothetical protein
MFKSIRWLRRFFNHRFVLVSFWSDIQNQDKTVFASLGTNVGWRFPILYFPAMRSQNVVRGGARGIFSAHECLRVPELQNALQDATVVHCKHLSYLIQQKSVNDVSFASEVRILATTLPQFFLTQSV